MLKPFLRVPIVLNDDDVMELLTFLFHGESALKKLELLIEKRKKVLEGTETEIFSGNKGVTTLRSGMVRSEVFVECSESQELDFNIEEHS